MQLKINTRKCTFKLFAEPERSNVINEDKHWDGKKVKAVSLFVKLSAHSRSTWFAVRSSKPLPLFKLSVHHWCIVFPSLYCSECLPVQPTPSHHLTTQPKIVGNVTAIISLPLVLCAIRLSKHSWAIFASTAHLYTLFEVCSCQHLPVSPRVLSLWWIIGAGERHSCVHCAATSSLLRRRKQLLCGDEPNIWAGGRWRGEGGLSS